MLRSKNEDTFASFMSAQVIGHSVCQECHTVYSCTHYLFKGSRKFGYEGVIIW